MAKYTVVVEYLLPIYRTIVVDATSVQDACGKAIEEANDTGWDMQKEDYESSSSVYVESIVAGEVDNVYDADNGIRRRVPVKFRRKAVLKGFL